MNMQIDSQVKNMIMIAKSFKQGCQLAAMKDDGRVDGKEKRQLKIIEKATDSFINELQKVI
ncbi:MAG: hypothetical protein J6J87_09035 [Oscillospiraceae bacterium]|nr:hypothetical protein [Oscillospiraceae bacterium]